MALLGNTPLRFAHAWLLGNEELSDVALEIVFSAPEAPLHGTAANGSVCTTANVQQDTTTSTALSSTKR